jgi:LacI family transcriptional regulator, galactose operon repressor
MSTATIRDVAAQAKVSIKTVSRVINNVTTVKAHTREKVLRVIRKLDYHPNPSARGLSGARSFLIGLLYDHTCDYYATGVLAGVIETCRAAHYQVIMQPCDWRSPLLADEISRNVKQSRAAGVILTPPLSDHVALLGVLKQQRIPYVRIAPAEHSDNQRSVYTNDRESSARMTEHLAALGHTRIGFIIGHPDHAAVADRYKGYLDGLKNCGLEPDKTIIAQGYNSHSSGMQCARKLLQVPDEARPTAIFASNDHMAAGVLAVAHSLGIAVPDELSVAGFDDVPLASQVWPALTTIRQPISAMSAKAADLLLQQLRDAPEDRAAHVLESSVTFRQSTGPAHNQKLKQVRSVRRAKAALSATGSED